MGSQDTLAATAEAKASGAAAPLGGFSGEVVVKPILPEGTLWTLVAPFSYRATRDTFTVPAGFITDFASVPRVFVWLLPRYGRWTQAAILHDYLCDLARTGRIRKIDADDIFNRAMRELGVPFLRRWVMWAAVRFASDLNTWLEGGVGDLMRMIAIGVPAAVFVALPALVVLVALIVGAAAEFIIYPLLAWLHRRDRPKDVNPPEPRDLIYAS